MCSVAIKGRLRDIKIGKSGIIYVTSGSGFRYSKSGSTLDDITGSNQSIRDEGVELSDAINSAKGFLFGLRKTLGDGVKRVQGQSRSIKVNLNSKVNQVQKQIEKELFDDDVYTNNDVIEQAIEALDDSSMSHNEPIMSHNDESTMSHNTESTMSHNNESTMSNNTESTMSHKSDDDSSATVPLVTRKIKKKIQISKPKSTNNSRENKR